MSWPAAASPGGESGVTTPSLVGSPEAGGTPPGAAAVGGLVGWAAGAAGAAGWQAASTDTSRPTSRPQPVPTPSRRAAPGTPRLVGCISSVRPPVVPTVQCRRVTVLQGGYPFYAAPVGILLLDARFPRPPGDIAYAETFDFPVVYRVVERATPSRVVDDGAAGLVDAFCAAARELEAAGVRAICTSCGFLALHQPALAAAVRVPVFTSSLLQIPSILTALAP